MHTAAETPRAQVTSQALTVWGAACLVYVVAITGRTSLGVAGVEAAEHFHIQASRLAVFTAVQVGIYAAAQIPTGVLIDRFGPRKLLVAGAIIMALGQIILGLTHSYPVAILARVLVGAGDATAFLSVMRILPSWFPLRKTPIFTQLTASLGQMGQFISAVPFMALLHAKGWMASFVTLGAAGALLGIAAAIVVLDSPAPQRPRTPSQAVTTTAAIAVVIRHPVCWQAFFTHWTALVPQLLFTLLWGVPLMTVGMGLSPSTAGGVLALNTVVIVATGPVLGIISARAGRNRIITAAVFSAIVMATWAVFFIPTDPRSAAAIIAVNCILAALTPVSNYGFDHVREAVDRRVLATGTGMANMGGFIAGMLGFQGFGLLLDHASAARGAAGDYTWQDFRLAALAVVAVWACGMIGLISCTVISRRKGLAPRI